MNVRSRQVLPWVMATVCLALSCKASKPKPSEGASAESKALLKNPTAPSPTAPLSAGDDVFDFNALAHNGQRLKLSEFLHKPVFIYFCSQDEAAICTQLAEAIRDGWLSLNADLSMAFGVSPENTAVHRAFGSKLKLPFLLLADTETSVHQVFGVKPGMVRGYLVGEDQKVRRVFEPLSSQGLSAALLQAVREPRTANTAMSGAAMTDTAPTSSAFAPMPSSPVQ